MSEGSILDGLRILVVDDEPDILEIVGELLSKCRIFKASTFAEAKKILESQELDLAVLDIMGVNGYGLLEIAREKNIPTVMLTAHAFTPDNLAKSIKEGADSYIPKEELGRIEEFLADVIKARKQGESTWKYWEEKLPTSYFERRWGAAWQNADKAFWNTFRTSIQTRKDKDNQ
ncbi:MAG: response regulator [Desulfobacteraceae bacterium]|nr:MAG: response regulator [Desulfobacteraceae bacterium]